MNEYLAPSERLIDALKGFEGFVAVARHMDEDPPGVITGGYGETHCYLGQIFTEGGAEVLLRKRAKGFGDAVLFQIFVPINEGEYDALTDLAYNCGAHGFHALIALLNAGDLAGAAAEFAKHVTANHVILKGLVARREEEKQWFESGWVESA